jgi:hypothetical protein
MLIMLMFLGFASQVLSAPVELESCMSEAQHCGEVSVGRVDSSCTDYFYHFRGRVAWRPLENQGPITVSVLTKATTGQVTPWPLYIELLRNAWTSPDSCVASNPGYVLLVAQGQRGCGTWESIGPIDLDHFVPRGALYTIMAEGFESPPVEPDGLIPRSVGLACVRVQQSVSPISLRMWTNVKELYRDATR